MDEKTYQDILSGKLRELDISDLSEEGKALAREFYEFLLQKQNNNQTEV